MILYITFTCCCIILTSIELNETIILVIIDKKYQIPNSDKVRVTLKPVGMNTQLFTSNLFYL